MKKHFPNIPSISSRWLKLAGLAVVLGLAVMFRGTWWPRVDGWINAVLDQGVATTEQAEASEADEHAGHDHSGHAHDETTALELSDKAMRNLGLTEEFVQPIEIETFRRSITIPATVVERPGRTRVQVATPMTGVVTHVHAVEGAAVEPGTLLFRIRLTHEDLVQAQTDFLKTIGELDVERKEIDRLREVTQSGAVAGRTLLERQYSRDKLEAILKAQREALRLHGLSENQVDQIAEERRLLRELQIFAPSADGEPHEELKLTRNPTQEVAVLFGKPGEDDQQGEESADALILHELLVHRGQSVTTGQTLAVLADYSELYIEGLAFEQDGWALSEAAKRGWPVAAVFEDQRSTTRVIDGLNIAYLDNEVDQESRSLRVFVRLPNQIVHRERNPEGRQFVNWQFRPGQRLQLRIPVEEWNDQIVLPVDAVAKEGAEYFVFQQNGNHFDRLPVHVKYRDQYSVVIANDGALYPGDVVALRGAHQMQMALKNKSGGGVDPHAGHNH